MKKEKEKSKCGAGYDPQWAKAKKMCRLNMDDIRKAKALGIKPRSLIKNNPSLSQQWKAPVKFWIRDLYAKRFAKADKKKVQIEVGPIEGPFDATDAGGGIREPEDTGSVSKVAEEDEILF